MRVAFVSLYAYPLFEPRCRGIFGGSEVRAWTFARALARRPGTSVAMIALDHGQPAQQVLHGVEIHRHGAYRSPHAWDGSDTPRNFSEVLRKDGSGIVMPRGAVAALRYGPRLAFRGVATHVARKLDEGREAVYAAARLDTLCVFGVSPLAAEAATYCRRVECKLVLILGTDEDLSERYYAGSKELNAYGSPGDACHFALTHADAIVTQTESQRTLLKERFGLKGTTIRNPIELGPSFAQDARDEILWIGKSDGVKRPELFVRLARELPALRFTLVMNISDQASFDRVAGSLPPNVRLVERVAFAESGALFNRAAVLVNTSRFEGVPNAFLQASAAGVPIASLSVDPDGMLSREGCGLLAGGDFDRLRSDVERLCAEPALVASIGFRARAYVERHHVVEGRAAELAGLLESL